MRNLSATEARQVLKRSHQVVEEDWSGANTKHIYWFEPGDPKRLEWALARLFIEIGGGAHLELYPEKGGLIENPTNFSAFYEKREEWAHWINMCATTEQVPELEILDTSDEW